MLFIAPSKMSEGPFTWHMWAMQTWITKEDRQYAKATGRKRGALQTALLRVLALVQFGVDPVHMSFPDDDMQFIATRFREDLAAMHWSLHGQSAHDMHSTSHTFEYPREEAVRS